MKTPKRPRDPAQLAKLIVDIATGEVEDREPTAEEQGKDPAAVAMGRKGGPAMAAGVSDRLWEVADIVALVEAAEAPAKKRGPYKNREHKAPYCNARATSFSPDIACFRSST